MPKKPVIAAQLYTLRNFCKTPADIASSLKRVAKIGYKSVQVSGIGKIEPKELASILDGEGLSCCVTHVGLDRMKNEAQAVIDEHKLWKCKYTAIGGYFPKETFTRAMWESFATDYSELARKFSAASLELGYHNHSHELIKVDGSTPLQMLIDKCSKNVWFEIDTYWITHGGGDPIAWINKVAGRIPCVHFKDMAMSPERQQQMAPVGEGNLNWAGIIEAARHAGAQYFVVEQDNCNGQDPFDCLAQSLRNLQAMGV
jgi:sugar phosphate isomerase/epimerase